KRSASSARSRRRADETSSASSAKSRTREISAASTSGICRARWRTAPSEAAISDMQIARKREPYPRIPVRMAGGRIVPPRPRLKCSYESPPVTIAGGGILRKRSVGGDRLADLVGDDPAVDKMDMAIHAARQLVAVGHGHDRRAQPVHEIA